MEVGQKIKWVVGKSTHKGLFLQKIDDVFSQVKCLKKDKTPFICSVNVVTELIEEDND